MPPVSRPTAPATPGILYVPASEPSALSAVKSRFAAAGSGAAAGAEAGLGAAPPRRKPHEPQKRFDGEFTCPHCGQVTVPGLPLGAMTVPAAFTGAGAGAAGATGAAGGIGARDCTGDGAIATVPPRAATPAAGAGAGACTAAAACAARMPWGGVPGEKGLGAASRGSSAPQPRQNL